jgi:carbamoyltransferase
MFIIGISAYYHDSAVCLLKDGNVVAAVQEERFNRKKHYAGFPEKALLYCLKEGGISFGDISCFVFYDKPLLKFERLLETYMAFAPRGFISFLTSMPVWLKDKLFFKSLLIKELKQIAGLGKKDVLTAPILFTEHHQSHAASAFFPSGFDEAAVLCLDGVGEWATTSAWHGKGNELTPLWEIHFPHSLGLLYSAFTYYTGFKVNSGEYKVMGLAPYGKPVYVQAIYDNLIDLKDDGTFRLNMEYFNYCTGLTMTGDRFNKLFGGPPRKPESMLTQKEMDLARSIQVVTEEIVLRLSKTLQKDTGGLENLCLAGGVALNCVANGRLINETPYKNIWIQPAAGDAGGALGAALAVWHQYMGRPRQINGKDGMEGSYLGISFDNKAIEAYLKKHNIPAAYMDDTILFDHIATELTRGKVIGWFQGRMEFGPRALGSRSIIGDPRNPEMQSRMNLKIKYRESFRPFAPSVVRESLSDYFDLNVDSPYMLLVAPVKKERRLEIKKEHESLWGIEYLLIPRSDIPAITHVDYSARIQTVHEETNPRYYRLIKAFEAKTGYGLLVNTSFNVRGEPIVCTPEDAYRCFRRTEMDVLVMENYVLNKEEQPELHESDEWQKEFELD